MGARASSSQPASSVGLPVASQKCGGPAGQSVLLEAQSLKGQRHQVPENVREALADLQRRYLEALECFFSLWINF